jgi:hypothetical protein
MFDCFYSEAMTTRVPAVPDHDPGDQQARYWRTHHNADQLSRNNRSYSSHMGHTVIVNCYRVRTPAYLIGGFLNFLMYFIQHRFICRPSGFTVPEDAGIEPRTVATFGIGSQTLSPLGYRSYPHSARPHPAHYTLTRIYYLVPFIKTILTRRKFLLSLPLSLDHNPRNLIAKNTWSAP